jgi:outer membrane protein assembly factor BamB
LHALDASSGSLVWSQRVGVVVRSAVAVAHDAVFVGADDLLAFDALSGKPLWAAGLAALGISSPPVVFEDYVLVGADDGSVVAVDRTTGSLLWTAMTTYGTGGVPGAPAVDGKLVYVGSTDGYLYAFELATGTQVWATYLAGGAGRWIWSSPAYANGVVYVASGGLSVDAVDAQSGKQLWTYAVPILYSSPAIADGTVYVGAEDGSLYAFRR